MAAIHLTFLSLKDHIIYIFVSHIGYIKMRLQVTQSMKLGLTVGACLLKYPLSEKLKGQTRTAFMDQVGLCDSFRRRQRKYTVWPVSAFFRSLFLRRRPKIRSQ